MAKDAYSKKFLVNNFMSYKMIDTKPVMKQFHEMLRILGHFVQHTLKMDEAILWLSSLIYYLLPRKSLKGRVNFGSTWKSLKD